MICQECKENFGGERQLHAHIKKHDISVGEYYEKHFPRFNKATGEPIAYKSKEQYFSQDFSNSRQLHKWCREADEEDVKEYIIEKLKERVGKKGYKIAPSYLDLVVSKMPKTLVYERVFGSYEKACETIGLEVKLCGKLPLDFWEQNLDHLEKEVIIDTREQTPIEYNGAISSKLDIGDYCLIGDYYSKTFVDRKSISDFKSTMSQGYERFLREIERAREFGAFLWVVVEGSLSQVYAENNFRNKHKANLEFVFHRMKTIMIENHDVCQFVFADSREDAKDLILRLLYSGNKVWNVDMQYEVFKKGNK